ncbi:MAG: hypothetical protein RR037_00195 [Alistipes sp.]
MTKDYIIAEFRIRITGGDWLPAAGNFARALHVFEAPADPALSTNLTLHTDCEVDFDAYQVEILDTFDFPEVNALCSFGRTSDSYIFTMACPGKSKIYFVKPFLSGEVSSNIALGIPNAETPSLFRFGLWMMFGIAINALHAIAIHSSVICTKAGAALFLGESGTGKSTHTQLWRTHIAGAYLLNDDSPIIRMTAGVATVYGSPWSGKTPCYKNESQPIRAMVRLSQAPHNAIQPLPVILAIGALLPSCPPAFAFDSTLQDNICETLSEIISHAPIYHLECLPNAAAATLSHHTIFEK